MPGFEAAWKHDNGVCEDYFVESKQFTNMSFRPIREQILQDEHLRMAIALEILSTCGIRQHQIKCCKTDAWYIVCKPWLAKKAQKALVSATFENMHKPSGCLHWNGPIHVESSTGEGPVFRFAHCEMCTVEKCSLFEQDLVCSPQLVPDIQVFREGQEDVRELALTLTREKRNFILFGAPGTGKSTLLRESFKLLPQDDQGRPLVTCCGRTHVASRQFDDGITLSRLKHKIQKGRRLKGAFCLDELFMTECALLDVVAKIALHGNVQMFFAGDDCQLPPIGNTFHGHIPPDLMTSDFMKGLAPVMIELNVCHRADQTLHNYGLLCRGDYSLDFLLAEARSLFCATGDPDICLCLSNDRRRSINQETNTRLKAQDATLLETNDGPAWLYKGLKLIGCKNDYKILNGCWYHITEISDKLHLIGEKGEEIVLSWCQAKEAVTLAHAMTIHKSQSRTLEGHVRICPGNEPGHVHFFFSRNHLLVAASRARGINMLSIE